MNSIIYEFPAFWLNFALHTALLSALVWMACRLMRDPAKRAYVAAVGIGAICVLPWISAMRLGSGHSKLPAGSEESAQATSMGEFVPTESPLPDWTIHLERKAPSEVPAERTEMISPSIPEANQIDLLSTAGFVWIAGSVMGLVWISIRQAMVVRWASSTREVVDGEWETLKRGDLRRDQFRISTEVVSPCVVGFYKPKIVIPTWLLESSENLHRTWAIKHEAEHLHAGDSRVAVLLSLAKALLWWNPVVHLLSLSWAADRERVCDARAVGSASERHRYGNFLLDLLEQSQTWIGGSISMARKGKLREMKMRLKYLMKNQPVANASLSFKAMVSCALLLTTTLIAFTGCELATVKSSPSIAFGKADGEIVEVLEESTPPDQLESDQLEVYDRTLASVDLMVVATQDPLPESGRMLSKDEKNDLLRRLSLASESRVMKFPHITLRSGQRANTEIYREVTVVSKKHEATQIKLGWLATFFRRGGGKDVMLDFRLKHTYLPDLYDENKIYDEKFEIDEVPADYLFKGDLVINLAEVKQRVMSSESTIVVPFASVEKGKHLSALVTVNAINFAGLPIPDFQSPDSASPHYNGVLGLPGD
ncbi:M56 family metallopeptidase [Luteolibacter pohnpeiensis]|uniref:M56 family metallopeptidase n=1 Tax=Luteolibacter pohnpeiensis TaxID=454153 RepID=A0A934VWF8_9BACT|nr:M56 family metallopeptidase [Luteolibacter pohnpeiensis]MBK1882773.1 M56 family metallopeptidase [Luteolibacter pohnpeiensis]